MGPIVDVHTHLFSAIDIPLEGYLRSRWSEKRGVRKWLENLVSLVPGPHVFGYLAERMRERCATRRLGEAEKRGYYRLLLTLFGVAMNQRLSDWEESLSDEVGSMTRELLAEWDDVDLFVPLMIDYEYWFKNSVDVPIRKQVESVYRLAVLPSGGKVHPFAPYDPARQVAHDKGMIGPDGQPERCDPLEMVRDAVENKGFIGVKLYNSLGYRPFGNSGEELDHRRLRLAVRNDKLRYLFDGPEYDRALCALYQYCLKEGVPITAHCVEDGIEAYPGASRDFGAPRLWRSLLDDHAFRGLHLNLAHFGWGGHADHGYAAEGSWVREICDMIGDYDHLWTDVSHHRVLSRTGRREFTAAYRAMRGDFSDNIEKIRRRMLYGSDWHVLRRVEGYEGFLSAYRKVARESGLYGDDEVRMFLGGNAMEFLGLLPGGKNRKRLKRFYERHDITPPRWFVMTGRGEG